MPRACYFRHAHHPITPQDALDWQRDFNMKAGLITYREGLSLRLESAIATLACRQLRGFPNLVYCKPTDRRRPLRKPLVLWYIALVRFVIARWWPVEWLQHLARRAEIGVGAAGPTDAGIIDFDSGLVELPRCCHYSWRQRGVGGLSLHI